MSQNNIPSTLPTVEKLVQRVSVAEKSQQKEIRISFNTGFTEGQRSYEIIFKDDNYLKLKVKEIELIVKYKPRFNSPYRELYEQSLVI
jgi:predicted component of viral defense system (DUF524 family)